jgi:UDP-N-acetylmuramoylalanine--D-glutamate ligase
VVGLARSGQAIARLLAARGEVVIGCDRGRPSGAEGLREAGVEVHLDTDGIDLLDTVRTVLKSPGVPASSPVIAAAEERGITVTGELELSWRLTRSPMIAVTGTNGKTTTTELIAHILREADRDVVVAGNIGTALAELVHAEQAPTSASEVEFSHGRVIVCECSSFQLEDAIEFAPECAVFLNLSPDHLDRHGSLDSYREAKLSIFSRQRPSDIAIVNGDDPASPAETVARRVTFGGPGCDVAREGTAITWHGHHLIETTELQLIGAHNEENAMAAAAAALAIGVDPAQVAQGLASFIGVAHRLEPVAELDGVLYVNDSKATNVAAASTGIAAFAGRVHVILGGSLKGEDFSGLVGPVAENCAACYLVGPAADAIESALAAGLAEALASAGREPDEVALRRCEDLEAAVGTAAAAATAGQVVLLSPACASFDAFRDFEERGERFREIVEALR